MFIQTTAKTAAATFLILRPQNHLRNSATFINRKTRFIGRRN
jgi:hypothetical protein